MPAVGALGPTAVDADALVYAAGSASVAVAASGAHPAKHLVDGASAAGDTNAVVAAAGTAPRVYDDRVHGRVLSECVSSSVS